MKYLKCEQFVPLMVPIAVTCLLANFQFVRPQEEDDTCNADPKGQGQCSPDQQPPPGRFRHYYFKPTPVPKLSAKDKISNLLIAAQQPLIITETNIVTSAMNWTLEYLRDNIGAGKFMLCLSDNNVFQYYDEKKMATVKAFKPPHKRIYVSFSEFFERFTKWKPGEPRMYLQEALKDGISATMLKDFASLNWEWANNQQKRNNWKEFTSNLLLIAQEGALTPAHFDEQENFLAQISGTKRVIFFSPSQFVNMYPYPYYHPCDRQSQVDFEKPDFTRFPKAAQVEAFEAVLNPGDVVYIPPFWWHHIESARGEGPTVSLTFWYKSAPYTRIEYPLQPDQKITMMRNIEKMMFEALNADGDEISSFFRDLTLGRYAQFPIEK